MLGEPTNDLDTDMLAAMEDLLDEYAGTLIVVSHDRYLIERVTDHQYGIFDGRLRHLPGGIDQYLALRREQVANADRATGSSLVEEPASAGVSRPQPSALSGAELRAAEKELASLERRIERLQQQAADAREALAELDQSDYERLGKEMAAITALDDEAAMLEERWLELSEQVG